MGCQKVLVVRVLKVSNDEAKVVLRSASASGLAFLDAPTDGSISGTVYEDNDANGAPDDPVVLLSGVTVYIDANNNGSFDVATETSTTCAEYE